MSEQSSWAQSSSHYTSVQLPPSPDGLRSTDYPSSEPVTERASSRLFLEGQGVRKTVKKLKRLMEVELRSSVEKNPNLAEAVFPDESLPVTIDRNLINKLVPKHPKRKRAKRQPAQQSYLNKPPLEWSEANIGEWLNHIGGALRDVCKDTTYTDVDGNEVTLPERIWRSDYSGIHLEGAETKRKPDLILVDKSYQQKSLTWSQVHALGEVTVSLLSKNKTIIDTIYQKSFLTTNAQENRNFVPSLYFTGTDSFTFEVCDRSGAVHSQTMKIADNQLTLLRIITGLMFGRPSDIGYDETIDCDTRGKARIIRVENKKYKVIESLFKAESMRGRVTRCWHVARNEGDTQTHYVIKDSWADERRTQSEISILERIGNLTSESFSGVPKLFKGEDVPVYLYGDQPGYKSDSTTRRRAADSKVEGRVHRRLLMQPVGKHITNCTSLKELVGGIIDAVKAHQTLYMNKILHRDISVNNILLAFEGEGQRNRGLLIDYDYAFLYKDQDPEDADTSVSEHINQSQEVLLHRTGTLPFMSTELLLSQKPVVHSEKHDLESFFWVLLYICTVYEAPNRKSEAVRGNFHPFGTWIQYLENIGTNEEGADTRLRAFGSFRSTLFTSAPAGSPFSDFIHPYFRPLTKLVDEFARAIFQVMKGGGKEVLIVDPASGTYESVLDVLNRAFNDLPDVDSPPPSLSPLSGLAFPSAPASSPATAFSSKQKGKGEFKIPALPTHKSPRKRSTSNVPDPDQSLLVVDQEGVSGPSTPSKRKAVDIYTRSTPRRSPLHRNKSGSSVGGDRESSTFAYGSDSGYSGMSTSLVSSHAGFSYGTGDMSTFSSEEIDDEDGIQRRGGGLSNKRTGKQRLTEETDKQPKRRRGF